LNLEFNPLYTTGKEGRKEGRKEGGREEIALLVNIIFFLGGTQNNKTS
jgi:hypothetical protein